MHLTGDDAIANEWKTSENALPAETFCWILPNFLCPGSSGTSSAPLTLSTRPSPSATGVHQVDRRTGGQEVRRRGGQGDRRSGGEGGGPKSNTRTHTHTHTHTAVTRCDFQHVVLYLTIGFLVISHRCGSQEASLAPQELEPVQCRRI